MGRRGFTLVEMLVTLMLVSVALVGVMRGIRALAAADSKARRADLLQYLAKQKVEELGTVTDPRTADDKGDFTEQGYPDISWTVDIEPSGVENVDEVTVTATQGNDTQSLTELLYVRPLTGTNG